MNTNTYRTVTRYVTVDRRSGLVRTVNIKTGKSTGVRHLGLLEEIVGRVPNFYKVTYRRGQQYANKGTSVQVTTGCIFKGSMRYIKNFASAAVCFLPQWWSTEFSHDEAKAPVTRQVTALDKSEARYANIR